MLYQEPNLVACTARTPKESLESESAPTAGRLTSMTCNFVDYSYAYRRIILPSYRF